MLEAAGISFVDYNGGKPDLSHPPLVLIHGAGGSGLHWPPEVRRMAGERVLSLDLPGHGRSDGQGEATIDAYTARVKRWLDAMNLERAVFAGHSMGGAIAISMALKHPSRVAGLILVGTGGRLRVHPMILETAAEYTRFEELVDIVIGHSFSEHAQPRLVKLARKRMAETSPQVLHHDFVACDQFDVMDQLSALKMPVQVISGREDILTPEKYSHFLVDSIPQAELALIDEAGHMVMLEKPKLVADVIMRFMRGFDGKE
jgi:pimeloyl-ACP methyl ester carboxylesterase